MLKKLPVAALCCLFSATAFSFQLDNTKNSSKMLALAHAYSVNTAVISDQECQKLMPSSWSAYQTEKDSAGLTSTVSSSNFKISNLQVIYRKRGLDKFHSKVFVHLWEGEMSFVLKGQTIDTPVIVSSIFDQNKEEDRFSLQSLYCNADVVIKNK